jgi:hypothetical protein
MKRQYKLILLRSAPFAKKTSVGLAARGALTGRKTKRRVRKMGRENTQVGRCLHIQRAERLFHSRCVGILITAFLLVVTIASGVLAGPDLKIAVRTTVPGQPGETSERVTYIHNDRRRIEEHEKSPLSIWPGKPTVFLSNPEIVGITRCDLDQTFWLNLDDREYMTMQVSKFPSKEVLQARAAQQAQPAPQPTLLIETTTTDTGERKQMFGYTARHVITSQKQVPLAKTGMEPQENVTDGWYIDMDAAISCDRASRGFITFATVTAGKIGEQPNNPVITFKNVGNPERGFALATKRLSRYTVSLPGRPAENRESVSIETQVTEISTEPLDAALFEVPKNFRKVSQIRRLPYLSYWSQALGWVEYYWYRLKRAL